MLRAPDDYKSHLVYEKVLINILSDEIISFAFVVEDAGLFIVLYIVCHKMIRLLHCTSMHGGRRCKHLRTQDRTSTLKLHVCHSQ